MTLVRQIAELQNYESYKEPARVALARGPSDVRAAALLRLGRRGLGRDGEGYALVEEALDDEDAEVRRVAFMVAVAARPGLVAALRKVDPQTHAALEKLEEGGKLTPFSASPDPELDEDARAPLFAALVCRSPDTALRGARGLGAIRMRWHRD